jgi:protein-S-isoprenylcysteine O-methyltransferase Ste14
VSIDYWLYGLHALYWLSFAGARRVGRSMQARVDPAAEPAAAAEAPVAAKHARLLVMFHGIGFLLMYFSIQASVVFGHVDEWFGAQRVVGGAIILAAAALAAWAVVSFASWRLQAKLDAGHQLATGGAFRYLRHPIYMSFNLLALGSAVWAPSAMGWAAIVLMAIGGDLRARAEEPLLTAAFGTAYAAYSARTRRFIPGLY